MPTVCLPSRRQQSTTGLTPLVVGLTASCVGSIQSCPRNLEDETAFFLSRDNGYSGALIRDRAVALGIDPSPLVCESTTPAGNSTQIGAVMPILNHFNVSDLVRQKVALGHNSQSTKSFEAALKDPAFKRILEEEVCNSGAVYKGELKGRDGLIGMSPEEQLSFRAFPDNGKVVKSLAELYENCRVHNSIGVELTDAAMKAEYLLQDCQPCLLEYSINQAEVAADDTTESSFSKFVRGIVSLYLCRKQQNLSTFIDTVKMKLPTLHTEL